VNSRSLDLTGDPLTSGRHYTLVCQACGSRQNDDGLILDCDKDHPPALLLTEYENSRFNPRPECQGIFRYRDWLPVAQTLQNAGRGIIYRSNGIGDSLGLPNLWIAFNGYWPERGAVLETATFKEYEAYTVLGRVSHDAGIMTVASSGNTGAAFAWACSQDQRPCLLIVPRKGLDRLRLRTRIAPCVNLVVIEDGDYPDAIELAAAISESEPFYPEGGVKNVGRRDGLATVLMSAFEEIGCLPSHYFQAVGSGAGAIAVLEAARRLRNATGSGRLPRLVLCQNAPFAPIYDAWQGGLRRLNDQLANGYRGAAADVFADELTNRMPPYGIRGGVYDSLIESHGDVMATDNPSVQKAMDVFRELEGVDIEPAAAVAVACLNDAVIQNKIDQDSVILLNVTGGGRRRLAMDYPLIQAEPMLRLTRESLAQEDAVHRIAEYVLRFSRDRWR
jgi:cysteate synthase